MNRAEELVADALALLHAHGHTPRLSENGGKHIKIRWLDAGRRYTLVISRSPSDLRARLNSRATLKRLLPPARAIPPPSGDGSMTIHTARSRQAVARRLDRKSRRGEDLRERVEIALNIMHEGHVLRFHFDRRRGPSWVLSPGNWPVSDEVARALIADPDVIACGDGLFADGPSQTYRFADGVD